MAKIKQSFASTTFDALLEKPQPVPDDAGVFLLPLPPEGDPKYLEALVSNVISAFGVFQGDALALDYCGVEGKTRQRVIKHPWYKQRTRILKAKKYLEEIKEIEAVTKRLGSMDVDEQAYDMRDPKSRDAYEGDFKNLFAMKLKAAEMRRGLLNLSREEDVEEAEQLQILFVPITRAELIELETVEYNEGSETGNFENDVEAVGGININASAAIKKGAELAGAMKEEEAQGGYKVNSDGSASDF